MLNLPKIYRKKKTPKYTPRHIQPCWDCIKATNPIGSDCPWSAKLKPVEGWKVKVYNRKLSNEIKEYVEILECPLFMKG